MTTSTTINLDTLTTSECKEAIDRIFTSAQTSNGNWLMSNEDVIVAHYGVMNNIQLRDYLLGAPYSHSLSRSIEGMEIIIERCKNKELETYQLETILAQFLYERGEAMKALGMLREGNAKDYSLARLLTRVMARGIAPEAFHAMRKELHPKVVQGLESELNLLANENNR
jgi:hypothetical protein